jgi:peptide/nickel transport system permease protein
MLAFVLQRLAQAILVMLVVGLISFSLFQFVGDPINNMVGPEATIEQRQALRERLGLNDPVPLQFIKWAGNALQGEFGLSYRMGKPVGELIAARLPATLELVFLSAVLALVLGVPMGVYTGLHRHAWLSRVFLTVSLIGISIPTFLIGILLILIFGVWLGWLPTFGRGGTVDLGGWQTSFLTLQGWSHIIMPAVTLALFQLTPIDPRISSTRNATQAKSNRTSAKYTGTLACFVPWDGKAPSNKADSKDAESTGRIELPFARSCQNVLIRNSIAAKAAAASA